MIIFLAPARKQNPAYRPAFPCFVAVPVNGIFPASSRLLKGPVTRPKSAGGKLRIVRGVDASTDRQHGNKRRHNGSEGKKRRRRMLPLVPPAVLDVPRRLVRRYPDLQRHTPPRRVGRGR